jgi:hypothetical protein
MIALLAALLSRALPAALASGRGLLTRAEWTAALAWLRPIERLVRMVILLAALARPWAGELALAAVASRRAGAGGGGGFRLPGFCAVPRAIEDVRERVRREAGEPETLYSAWVLVERLEAALRALEEPAPWIERAARRLGRRQERTSTDQMRRPASRGLSDVARGLALQELSELLAIAGADTS